VSKFNDILRGKFLVSDDSFKNWGIIIFISVLALIMIASSHSADKKVHEIARLTDKVKELRSEMSESKTRLMQLKMESNVVKRMVEKDIAPSEIPPNKIIVKTIKE
jgi:hypothetical protein|tara:strand:- start:242 stop:559 length:318 start_codon:yes stop_codon:yes gene_type:complete